MGIVTGCMGLYDGLAKDPEMPYDRGTALTSETSGRV